MTKSFLLLFFKKEALYLYNPTTAGLSTLNKKSLARIEFAAKKHEDIMAAAAGERLVQARAADRGIVLPGAPLNNRVGGVGVDNQLRHVNDR